MAFRSVNFWKNLSTRWSVHVLLAQQRPGNELVILRGVSREWYLFEKDCGNEGTTFLVWSWLDFILRTCSCTLLRIRKNGERALLRAMCGLFCALWTAEQDRELILKRAFFIHCPNRVQSYTRYCRWSRLLYLNTAGVSPPWGTVTPQANMEVTLPHLGKNYGHRSV